MENKVMDVTNFLYFAAGFLACVFLVAGVVTFACCKNSGRISRAEEARDDS